MTKKIFRAIFLVALAAMLCCVVLIMGVLYEYFSGLQLAQLRTQSALAARGVEANGRTYFDGLDTQGVRLTWIDAGGTVLYDTDTDAAAMGNQELQGREVLEQIRSQALHEGRGVGIQIVAARGVKA